MVEQPTAESRHSLAGDVGLTAVMLMFILLVLTWVSSETPALMAIGILQLLFLVLIYYKLP